MIMTTEKIFVGIDDQVIELTGADKEAFLLTRKTKRRTHYYLKRSIKPSKMHAHQL
jgi:hypothetical protein